MMAPSKEPRPATNAPSPWRVRDAVMLGTLAGALHAVAIAALIAWRFRADILAPPLAGRVQLFDPASKLLGFIRDLPGDFLHHFYGPGLAPKISLVIDLLAANLLLGSALGLVLGAAMRWLWAPMRSAWQRCAVFGLGFLASSAVLHVVSLVPAVVDPHRPRPLRHILGKIAGRMATEGPASDLALTAAALALAAWLGPQVARARGLRAMSGAALATAVLLALASAPAPDSAIGKPGVEPHTAISVRPRNVVLISIDSLRADHLGCYGYERLTSPVMDRLAAQSVRFATAYAPTSWTLPSHATMLTGRYPLSHGAVLRDRRLSSATPTLATVLRGAGYTTGGFVSYEFLRRRYGFDAGFDYFDDFTTELGTEEDQRSQPTGPLLNAQIIPWIERNAERPFFLFVHYFDVHYHYDPPPPYDTMFDPDYVGPDLRQFTRNPAIHAGMPRRHLEQLIALYDGEIRFTDRVVGEVIETIDRLGIGGRTLFIVTADHGEEFFEHGEKAHGRTLYDEVLLVPLLMRWPDGFAAGHVVDVPVSLVDLAPTIYDLVGVAPSPGLEGRSLVPLAFGEQSAPAPIYAHLFTPKRPIISAMIRSGNEKYLQDLHSPRAGFYELEADPGEHLNLVDEKRGRVLAGPLLAWLRQQWSAHRELPSNESRIVIDSDNIDRLRALGYVD